MDRFACKKRVLFVKKIYICHYEAISSENLIDTEKKTDPPLSSRTYKITDR